MSVSALAVARLFERDPVGTMQRYDAPVLLWDVPTPALGFDEFSPRRTHDFGHRDEVEEVLTEPAFELPEESDPLLGAVLFPVQKSGNAADDFRDCVTIGRSVTNDVQLDHRSVSRFHAFIRQDRAGRWTVSDAESRNGTFVQGVRLQPREAVALQTGDLLRVGQVTLRFFERGHFFAQLTPTSNADLPRRPATL